MTEPRDNHLAFVLLEFIGGLSYRVDVRHDSSYEVSATAPDGQVQVVRAADLYDAAVELALQVGIDLKDG